MRPKKLALWFLICSVGASALIGIFAILSGNFGDFEGRIILTTLTISGASVCALAAGALWEARNTKFLPLLTIIFAVAAAGLLIFAVWSDTFNDNLWRFTASVSVLTLATSHACVVSLAKLAPRFAWLRLVAFLAIFFLAACLIYSIYFNPKGDLGFRIMGVTAIVAAALTIMMPIFHRLSRADFDVSRDKAVKSGPVLHPTITCPACGSSQPNAAAELRCSNCGCRFIIQILEPPAERV